MTVMNKRLLGLYRAKIALEGLKRKDVAAEVGIGPRIFSDMLNGKKFMPLEIRLALLEKLELQEIFDRVKK